MQVTSIKNLLGSTLVDPQNLHPPAGFKTGVSALDDFLLWQGIPCGELSIFYGPYGCGAMSLVLHIMRYGLSPSQYTAWIQTHAAEPCPLSFDHLGVRTQKLFTIKGVQNEQQLLWSTLEILRSRLFDVVVCDLGAYLLRRSHLQKLKATARRYRVALIFIAPSSLRTPLKSDFALIVNFQKSQLIVERAQHRSTPFKIPRSALHAHHLPDLSSVSRLLCG